MVGGVLALAVDEVTRAIFEWIASVLPESPVLVRSSADWSAHKGIALRLLSARPLPTPRAQQQPLSIRLDYLVTPSFDDIFAEHRCLGELLFAAFDRADIQIIDHDDAAAMRREFNVPLRAGILLSTNLQRHRTPMRAPPVRQPLVVRSTGLGRFEGVVLGDGDIPLVDALVEMPALNRSVLTDLKGRFSLSGPLISGQPTKLIATKNHSSVGVDVADDRPLTIRIPLES
ncbi:hypothetical protein JQ582_33075 [Bradyrhizobium japonicum]|uniref:hypothetical protein n=1 Tax=Bradyrhizobium japonicum TaxID=375 RepID=UPI001BA6C3EE|nr:hypothetical protein [Bradyrhizobium japonicum]MBR0748775.1 hypothetical protein [Bradyrhizobium japonicum]